jgi:hypothetical protein
MSAFGGKAEVRHRRLEPQMGGAVVRHAALSGLKFLRRGVFAPQTTPEVAPFFLFSSAARPRVSPLRVPRPDKRLRRRLGDLVRFRSGIRRRRRLAHRIMRSTERLFASSYERHSRL